MAFWSELKGWDQCTHQEEQWALSNKQWALSNKHWVITVGYCTLEVRPKENPSCPACTEVTSPVSAGPPLPLTVCKFNPPPSRLTWVDCTALPAWGPFTCRSFIYLCSALHPIIHHFNTYVSIYSNDVAHSEHHFPAPSSTLIYYRSAGGSLPCFSRSARPLAFKRRPIANTQVSLSKLCQNWLRHWRGTLYLCTAIHWSSDAVSTLWKVWALTRLWKQHSVQACKVFKVFLHQAHPPWVTK